MGNWDKIWNYKRLPNKSILIFIIITLPCFMLYRFAFENDTYWLLNTGKYILSNGFPSEEPFTMHKGLSFSAQQWLTTVVFYFIYKNLGTWALYVLNIAVYVMIGYVVYTTSLRISKNNLFVSAVAALVSNIILSFYMVLRPQIFSIAIFALEIYLLEAYVKERKVKYLAFLPVLSMLLVNLHSAMWLFFFVLSVPYIIDGLNLGILKIKTQGYGIKAPIIAIIVSFGGGILNPYGFTNMFYLFNSYGSTLINTSIQEMKSPDFKNFTGMAVFGFLAILAFAYTKVRSHTRLRYVLIIVGTLYMALSSLRSIPLFVVCSLPFTAYYLKDIKLPAGRDVNKKFATACIVLIAFMIGLIFAFRPYNYDWYIEDFTPKGAVDYMEKSLNLSYTRVYNGFDIGGYLEFRGITTFIDSRAEIFLKSINKKEDIFRDYIEVIRGDIHYRDFIKKYSLNCFLVKKDELLSTYLMADSDYKKVYEDKKFAVYVDSSLSTKTGE